MNVYALIDWSQEQGPLAALSAGIERRWIQLHLGVPLNQLRQHCRTS
jgi:hypothetical protein